PHFEGDPLTPADATTPRFSLPGTDPWGSVRRATRQVVPHAGRYAVYRAVWPGAWCAARCVVCGTGRYVVGCVGRDVVRCVGRDADCDAIRHGVGQAARCAVRHRTGRYRVTTTPPTPVRAAGWPTSSTVTPSRTRSPKTS